MPGSSGWGVAAVEITGTSPYKRRAANVVDYYDVLGVDRSTSLEDMKRAYRRKALKVHPDMGGSHEEMVTLTEAWAVLSNSLRRAAYDKQAAGDGGAAAIVVWHDVQRAASAEAREYPRRWADFEKWLDSVIEGALTDVAAAEYGTAKASFFEFPTSTGSVSGGFFIFGGAVAALLVLFIMFPQYRSAAGQVLRGRMFRGDGYVEFGSQKVKGLAVIFWFTMPAVAGATAGKALHKAWRDEVRQKRRGGGETTVIACGNCGRRLRFPSMAKTLQVTCPACRFRFSWPLRRAVKGSG
jgi:DNA-directed RNA polymerase subunit RPC12/RpoP